MKKLMLLVAFLCVFSFMVTGAYAIGISPGRIEVGSCPTCKAYTPGDTVAESFKAINNEGRDLYVEFYASGDLASYVKFDAASTTLSPGEIRPMAFRITIPENLTPGKHDTRVGLVESLPGGSGMLAARAGVEMQYWIYVPYPEKYIDISFSASSAKKGEPVTFTLGATNMGVKDLSSVSISIGIYDYDNNLVKTIELAGKPIASGKSDTFTASWTTVNIGVYTAKATITYDGETREASVGFKVGDLLLQINDAYGSIVAEKINKVVLEVESMWPEKIDGVYAELSGIGPVVKTDTISIDGWGKANLTAYVDASDLKPGDYDVKVTVYYSGKTVERVMKMSVVMAPIAGFDLTTIIIIIVIALAVLLILKKRNII